MNNGLWETHFDERVAADVVLLGVLLSGQVPKIRLRRRKTTVRDTFQKRLDMIRGGEVVENARLIGKPRVCAFGSVGFQPRGK